MKRFLRYVALIVFWMASLFAVSYYSFYVGYEDGTTDMAQYIAEHYRVIPLGSYL